MAGGIAAPGSHRSRRDGLPSPGSSHQPGYVPADPLPVDEEAGLANEQSLPPSLKPAKAPQAPILLPRPSSQIGTDTNWSIHA